MAQKGGGVVLVVGATGVVFGDIGTSILYAMQAVMKEGSSGNHQLDAELIYGMTSTLVWSMTLIVTVLYVRLLLRTDNEGEGGLLALLGLLRARLTRPRAIAIFTVLGMIGAAMFLGDSVITPAISVLSAAEGLELIDPSLSNAVVPMALVVLAALFFIQRFGTGRIGRLFGPIMIIWFAATAACGVVSIAREPSILQALSPQWIVRFFATEPTLAFLSLGSVVLAVTGAEALYADLGHFGRRAISRAWLLVVFPALLLNYLGQAALVIRVPTAVDNPFYYLVPGWGRLPMVVLATLATIIASQAVISGAFTVVHQAAQLGFVPPLRTIHTSRQYSGQIYMPAVNWVLAIGVFGLVLTFRHSASLAAAYGVAVTSTIAVTTVMYVSLTRLRSRRISPASVVGSSILAVVLVFLAATAPKVLSGGWLPLSIGAVLFTVMSTWRSGQRRIDLARREHEAEVNEFFNLTRRSPTPPKRVAGSVVFLTRESGVAPMALQAVVTQNHVLHRHVVLLSWQTAHTPVVSGADHVRVDAVGDPDDGIVQVSVLFGYSERPDLVAALRTAEGSAPGALEHLDLDNSVYFLSIPVVRFDSSSTMMRWRQRLFLVIIRLTTDPVEALALPRERTILIGREISL